MHNSSFLLLTDGAEQNLDWRRLRVAPVPSSDGRQTAAAIALLEVLLVPVVLLPLVSVVLVCLERLLEPPAELVEVLSETLRHVLHQLVELFFRYGKEEETGGHNLSSVLPNEPKQHILYLKWFPSYSIFFRTSNWSSSPSPSLS